MAGTVSPRWLEHYRDWILRLSVVEQFRKLATISLLLFGSLTWAQVSVPLTVQESLWPSTKAKDATAEAVANSAPGIARTNEPWTGGVPLLDSWAVSASSPQVGLSGSSVAMGQFSCMATWPSGHCKWLLVDTQIPSLSAGGTTAVTLGAGTGNFGGSGSNMAVDNGTTITVTTGAATFTIKKANFNLFDIVTVGGSTLVSTGKSSGLVLQGPVADASTTTCASPLSGCTTLYQSSSDAASTCSIEENGKVRVSLLCTGSLKNGTEAYLAYTLRMHFYFNSTRVKIVSELKNALEDTGAGGFKSASKGFRSYEMRLAMNGLTSPVATFATNGGTKAYTFTGSENAYSWQGFSSKFEEANWQNGSSNGVSGTQSYIQRSGSAPYNYVMDGYQIDAHGSTVASGTRNQYQDGWADLAGAGGTGVTIGGYQFSSYWPKSLQFMGGGTDVRIGIWPDQSLWLSPATGNGNVAPYWIPWPKYWIDTVYLNFHSAAVTSPGNEILRMQEALVARAPYTHYNASGVLFFNLNDPVDTDNYIKNVGATCVGGTCPLNSMDGPKDFAPSYWHNYGWNGGGGSNQADFQLDYLMQFYTRGYTGRMLWGWNKIKFIMETAYARADGFTWTAHSPHTDLGGAGFPTVPSANYANTIDSPIDTIHPHTYGVIDYYFLTGDRTLKKFIDQAFADRWTDPNIGVHNAPTTWIGPQRQVGIELMSLARIHNYAASTGLTTAANNAITSMDSIYNQTVKPDLAVSGTGTSTTHDNVLLPNPSGTGTYGISRTRGLYFTDTSEGVQGVTAANYNAAQCARAPTVYTAARLSQPYEVEMAMQGLDEMLQERGTGWTNYKEARDLNLGMLQWALSEPYNDDGTAPNSGFTYSINPDHVCSGAGTTTQLCECAGFYFGAQTVWFIPALYLKYTGDTSKNISLVRNISHVQLELGNNWDENGGYGVSNAIYLQHHPPATQLKTVALTSFANNGGGSYTLGWAQPPGTRSYSLKHSGGTKAVVDWLNFNIRTGTEASGLGGTFGIDPAANMPWFAASYTATQPVAGNTSITVNGLPTTLTQSSFMLKAFVSTGSPPDTGPPTVDPGNTTSSTPVPPTVSNTASTSQWTKICDSSTYPGTGCNPANFGYSRGYNWRLPYDSFNHEFLTYIGTVSNLGIYSNALYGYSTVTHAMVLRRDSGVNGSACDITANPDMGHPLGFMAFDSGHNQWMHMGGLCGGLNNAVTSIYDATTHTMKTLTNKWLFSPTCDGTRCGSLSIAWSDGWEYVPNYGKTIIVAGEFNPTRVYEFDGASTYTQVAYKGTNPPPGLQGAGLVTDGTYLYLLGGCQNGAGPGVGTGADSCAVGGGTALNDLYRYDPAAKVWSLLSPLGGIKPPTTSTEFGWVLYDSKRNRIVHYDGNALQLWQYDIASNTWSTFSALSSGPNIASWSDQSAIVIGGSANSAGYDPQTDTAVFMFADDQTNSPGIYELAFGSSASASTTFGLTVSLAGTGSVTSADGLINCGATCVHTYNSGASVVLTATPSGGSPFAGWSGDCSGPSNCSLTMNAPHAVTATFNASNSPSTFSLTVSKAGSSTGAITSSDPFINCGAACIHTYNSGASVVLTATPSGGSTFAGWSGDCSGPSTCSLTMNAPHSVSATFNASNSPSTFSLTVSKSGGGTSTISSADNSISCGTTCFHLYNNGASVVLTAAPGAGSTFARWSGDCSGTGTCSLTMNATHSVSAAFNASNSLSTFSLTVSKTVGGTGTLSSADNSISCGTTCFHLYNSGASVVLKAAPSADSTFVSWSGDCSGTGPCSLIMNAAHAVSATFRTRNSPSTFSLTVSKTGGGTGTIASNDSLISCGATCVHTYNRGAPVMLTAAPSAGSTFTGWSGACSGTGTCSLTMNAAHAVSAIFNANDSPSSFSLSVSKTGTTGTIASNDSFISCGATCVHSYSSRAQVVLTATPSAGSTFAGWSGDCSGTGTCSLTMNAAHAVSASFNAAQVEKSSPTNGVAQVSTDANTKFNVDVGNLSALMGCADCGFQSAADMVPGQTTEVRLRPGTTPPIADQVILKKGAVEGTITQIGVNQFVIRPIPGTLWPPTIVVITGDVTQFLRFPGGSVKIGQKVSVYGLLFKSGTVGSPNVVAEKVELHPSGITGQGISHPGRCAATVQQSERSCLE